METKSLLWFYDEASKAPTSFCTSRWKKDCQVHRFKPHKSYPTIKAICWIKLSFYLDCERWSCGVITFDRLSILINQEFCKVPLNVIPKDPPFSRLQELVHWCSIITIHFNLHHIRWIMNVSWFYNNLKLKLDLLCQKWETLICIECKQTLEFVRYSQAPLPQIDCMETLRSPNLSSFLRFFELINTNQTSYTLEKRTFIFVFCIELI